MVATVAGHGMCWSERRSRGENEGPTALGTSGVEGLQREALSPLSDSKEETKAQGAGHPGGVGGDDSHDGGEEDSTQSEGEGSRATPGPGSGHGVDQGLSRGESEESDGPGQRYAGGLFFPGFVGLDLHELTARFGERSPASEPAPDILCRAAPRPQAPSEVAP